MFWDSCLGSLKAKLPKFNDYLLKGYREEQVHQFKTFMDTVFSEAVRLFDGEIKYLGSHPLNPERRAIVSFSRSGVKSKNKAQFNIQQNELELYEFVFEYEGERISSYIYLPYLYNGALIINGTKYYLQIPLIERVISRTHEGVVIKVLRSPLQFWRSEQLSYRSTTNEMFIDSIVTVKAHYGANNKSKRQRPPLLLYLLANKNFYDVMSDFGYTPDDISFTTSVPDAPDPEYLYFETKNNVYIKARRCLMTEIENIYFRRIVVSLISILRHASRVNASIVYGVTFYQINLGRHISQDNPPESLAASNAITHLDSLKTYLDEYTRNDLRKINIDCSNIFELFNTVFICIDKWLFDYQPNDLFGKRVGGVDLILHDVVYQVNNRFYEKSSQNGRRSKSGDNRYKLNRRTVTGMLSFNPMMINSLRNTDAVRTLNSFYNDNMLTSTMIKKIRQTSSTPRGKKKPKVNPIHAQEHQFHPSMLSIESALAISQSNPGNAGDINPFAVIDKSGYFHKELMPWYKEVEPLNKFLV